MSHLCEQSSPYWLDGFELGSLDEVVDFIGLVEVLVLEREQTFEIAYGDFDVLVRKDQSGVGSGELRGRHFEAVNSGDEMRCRKVLRWCQKLRHLYNFLRVVDTSAR